MAHASGRARPSKRKSPENISMNIPHISAVCLALVSSIAPWTGSIAQSATPSVRCDAESVKVCEKINNMNVRFVLGNVDEATIKSYSRLIVTYNDGRATSNFTSDCQNDISDDFMTHTLGLGTLTVDQDAGVKSRTLSIISAYFENSANDRLELELAEPSSVTWTVYGTPVPGDDLPADDHRRLSILNDQSACGFSMQLETGSAWADISTYEWTIANSADFTITGYGPDAMLSQKRYAGGVYASTAKSTKVTVRQTVGGTCSAEYTKEFSLLGRPEAAIDVDASAYPDGVVQICSSAQDEADKGCDFSGWVTVNGVTPMTVQLTTGDKFLFSTSGRQSFKNARATAAGRVTVAEVVDANGCVADASTPDLIHGGLTVYDRKPDLRLAADSIYCDGTGISIPCIAESELHDVQWGVVKGSAGLDAGVSGSSGSAWAWSRMVGRVGYYAVETAPRVGLMPECPSDTAFVAVYFDMPLRYPNAISPNGDGKNDKLVIERLPPKNHLLVFDGRGKLVYDKADYRNRWGADDLEDGYYVYVLKGDGIKTIKETLAVKRTNK